MRQQPEPHAGAAAGSERRIGSATADRHGPGDTATGLCPGDFILTHRDGAMPRFIRFAERRRYRGADRVYATWSHAALVVDDEGTLVEAEANGVVRSPLEKYRDVEYHAVRSGELLGSRAVDAVAYAGQHVGKGFGFLVLFSLTVWLLTGIKLELARRDHQICSGLVARALAEAGQTFSEDPTFMLPADLAAAYGIRPATVSP